ncbi:MAG: YfhO family protein, partial [Bacteroidota bacterium]
PHGVVVLLLITVARAYFYPVLQGKRIYQSDIVQYIGMAKEQKDFRKHTGEEPYWTNSAFGGMPTYQLGAYYPHNYVKKLDRLIRFLPRPADYLFLYFISFYVLLLVLKVEYRYAFLGALAFGLSTYLVIILGVGHNAKAHAIGYFPLVLAGIFLVFQRKYLWGFLLTAIAMALEINANHFQMTYYLMFLVLVVGLVYGIDTYRKKALPHFFRSVGLLSIAVLLSLMVNATNLLATQEYARWSTRSQSELTLNPDGSPKEVTTGLSKEYITEYSYGISESLNLFVPRLFGGSNGEALGETSKTYAFLVNQGVPANQAKSFSESLPTYWGKQPIVEAPAYVGAVVLFLFVLALFVVKGPLKWWLIGGTLLSLVLSWGKHFNGLTDIMIDYFPLYDKFRAVSSAQVILELCVPLLAILGLVQLCTNTEQKQHHIKALKWTTIIALGGVVLLFLTKGMFSFEGLNDAYYRQQFTQMGLPQLFDIIVLDRKAMYNQDLFRSFIFVLLSSGTLWLFLKGKLKQNAVIIAFAALLLTDLGGIGRRYVNAADFVSSRTAEKPFQANAADTEILKDTAHFRVFEPALGLSGARTSYFHQAIGGYHAAKPRRFQELYEFHIANNTVEVLNMLNIKYILQQGEDGRPVALTNPFANGNAWFIDKIELVNSADEELKALDSLNTKHEAIVDKNQLAAVPSVTVFQRDSTASIQLSRYQPNRLTYKTSNAFDGLALFSEMYYPQGWKVTIDGNEAIHFRANYVLRALEIPAGEHTVEFRFQPEVIQKGSRITLVGSIMLGLVVLGGLFYTFKRQKTLPEATAEDT